MFFWERLCMCKQWIPGRFLSSHAAWECNHLKLYSHSLRTCTGYLPTFSQLYTWQWENVGKYPVHVRRLNWVRRWGLVILICCTIFRDQMPHSNNNRNSRRAEWNKRHPCLVAVASIRTVGDRSKRFVIVELLRTMTVSLWAWREENWLLVIVPESCLSIWHFLRSRHGGGGGKRRVTGEIFHDSNGFGVSYRFVGMIMTVPHCSAQGWNKLLLCV